MRMSWLCFVIMFFTSSSFLPDEVKLLESCKVLEFYEGIIPEYGVKALTTYGRVEDIEVILMPARIKKGMYNIKITHKNDNLYQLEGTKYFIETGFCFNYGYYQDGILKVEKEYGYTKGNVYFDP